MLGGMSGSQPVPAASPALIAEATKRAGLIWVEVPGGRRPWPAWHVWRDDAVRDESPPGEAAPGGTPPGETAPGTAGRGAAYLLTGPGEQPVPGLAQADRVTVLVASKDTGGLLVSWEATVSRVATGTPEWDAVIGSLVTGRLNATTPPGPGQQVYRLSPA